MVHVMLGKERLIKMDKKMLKAFIESKREKSFGKQKFY